MEALTRRSPPHRLKEIKVDRSGKTVGIKDLAEALGVSIGTVDRALHNRPGINSRTRARVMQAAKELSYRPNTAARSLKLSRQPRIGVFLPENIASFYNIMREGIRETAAQWSASSRLDLVFHSYPRLGEGDIESLLEAKWQDYDGIIASPGDAASLRSIFRKAEGLPPVVFVGSDAPRLHRFASIAVDAMVSGSIAAELLGGIIVRTAPVAVITGDMRVQDHADKLRGFAASLATLSPHLFLLPPIEAYDDADTAYTRAAALFREQPELAGLYVNTANSIPVLQAAEESSRLGKVKIITTDFFPELIPMIESSVVLASLYQRPYSQGRMAVETLIRYFSGVELLPEQQTRLAPHIVLRSNIEIFVRLMQRDDASA